MSVYAPGRDAPPAPETEAGSEAASGLYHASRGAGGVFARDIQGATPKYARNNGDARADNFRDTLCRFFVRVDQQDRDLFRRSIADPVLTSTGILNRIAGDPRGNKGYVDFILTNASLGFQELIQVGQVLSGNHLVYTFDQQPVTLEMQGATLNTVQDDQTTHFIRLYLHLLRATALARRQKALSIKFDAYVLTGVLTSFRPSFEAKFEAAVPFAASFLVKRLAITEYTTGWRPTSVGTPFATDLNAVPSDTRVFTQRPLQTATFRRPADLDEEVASGAADARVGQEPPRAAADARPSEAALAQAALLQASAANARAQATIERTTAEAAQARDRIARAERTVQAEGGLFGNAFVARTARQELTTARVVLQNAERQHAAALRERATTQRETIDAAARVEAARRATPPTTTPAPGVPRPNAVRNAPTPETAP